MQLIDEEWSWEIINLEKFIEEKNYPQSWKDFFERQDIIEELRKISEKLDYTVGEIYPRINNLFRAFIPLEKIKVVILGQDPYHDGNAVGLCFSVAPNRKINPSLRNIYNELENEGYKIVKNGSLVHWMNQGCFMLNTALTVERGIPNSHTVFWYNFTRYVIQYISEGTYNISWLLMGKNAIEFRQYIHNDTHNIFCTSHPSPFSANKNIGEDIPSFLGSNVFNKINEKILEKIVW